jgi:small conductance mechanosensitive channel
MEHYLPMIIEWAVRVVGILAVFWFVSKLSNKVRDMLVKKLEAKGFDATIARFLGNMLHYAVMLMTVLSCLGAFGIETTSFAAVIGGSALAIGLAFQGTLSNVAAGVMLIILRPFKAGDVVNAAGQLGAVQEIGLLATVFDTPDNRRIIVPNSAIFGGTIENVTHHPKRRIDVTVGVDYTANIPATRVALLKAANSVSIVHAEPAPAAILTELADSSLNFKVRIWCDTKNYFAAHEAVTQAVKEHLDAAGIGIPYPQMDVHMDGKLG